MIELRTLGLLDLRGADGYELRPVLQQPKRLALLAYLAVAHPQRFHRRDALVAMFWPELDADHARAALRRALYFLRRSLGEGVIVGRGDDDLGVAASEISCDAVLLQRAVDESRPADALALYRGTLLEGFYVSGTPDFERWLEERRAQLHACASAAAWTLADQAERIGDVPGATACALRAATLAPMDERAHRRLLALLDRVGDRLAALRAYDEFTRRLRVDYELEPDAETQALVASIRSRREQSPITASAAVSTPARGSRTAIAVLPFAVLGNREYAYLGEGMVDLLGTTLDGAGDVRTVDPRALLGYLARTGELGPGEPTHADPEWGRSVARRFDAGLFVLGSVVEAAGRLRVRASLYDATSDDTTLLVTAEVAGTGESGVFDLVDGIARRLLAGQSAGPEARLSRLAALTTESLPALKAYLRGECEFRAGRYLQALDAFQSAVAEDASFALAHYRAASAAAAGANLELAREATEQAAAYRDRLADRDRALLDAQRAWLRGDADEAERQYTSIVSTYVEDIEAWFLLGDVLFHHNPQRGRSVIEAREAFERALSFDPAHLSSLVHLARLAALEGQADELHDLVERVLKLSPAGDRALSVRALRAFSVGNEIEKARVLTALTRSRALSVGIAFTDIVLYARDIDGAHRLAKLLAKVTRGVEERALCHLVLAHLELTKGHYEAAMAELSTAERFDVSWALEVRGLFAALPFLPIPRGDIEAARDALVRWDPRAAEKQRRNQVLAVHNDLHAPLREYLLGLLALRLEDTDAALGSAALLAREEGPAMRARFASVLARTIRAGVAAARGDRSEALRILDGARGDLWYQQSVTSPFFSRAYERYLHAELLNAEGAGEEALSWYGTLGESSPYELIYLAPAHLRQGELCEQRGDLARASHHFTRCARLWSRCDDVLAGVRDRASARLRTVRRQ